MLNRANIYYENDKERLREWARDKYRNLSEEKKNRYHNMSEENKQKLKNIKKITVRLKKFQSSI